MSIYGMDLRRKVVEALEQGQRPTVVARRFTIDPKTVRSWRDRHAAGRLEPDRGGNPGTGVKLTEAERVLLRRWVRERPGITLGQMVERLAALGGAGSVVAESTVCRALIKMGYRYKKSLGWRASG